MENNKEIVVVTAPSFGYHFVGRKVELLATTREKFQSIINQKNHIVKVVLGKIENHLKNDDIETENANIHWWNCNPEHRFEDLVHNFVNMFNIQSNRIFEDHQTKPFELSKEEYKDFLLKNYSLGELFPKWMLKDTKQEVREQNMNGLYNGMQKAFAHYGGVEAFKEMLSKEKEYLPLNEDYSEEYKSSLEELDSLGLLLAEKLFNFFFKADGEYSLGEGENSFSFEMNDLLGDYDNDDNYSPNCLRAYFLENPFEYTIIDYFF